MKVDAVLVTERFETEKQPYSRFVVLDSRWILRVEHYNYVRNPTDEKFNFESKKNATNKLISYLNGLDKPYRTLHIYQDDLDLLPDVSEMEMTVYRYRSWF